ncbi:MAG: zinc-dependent metalloprotease [Rikenellaceae bacterium]
MKNLARLSLVLTLMLFTASGVCAQNRVLSMFKQRSKKTASAVETEPKEKLTDYQKLFKDKQVKSVDGLFKLHLIEDKLYTEVPIEHLGREFVINTYIEESSNADYGLSGQQPSSVQPYHFTLVKVDSTIQMRDVQPRVICEDSTIAGSVAQSSVNTLAAIYKIMAYNEDSTSVVIENTALFTKDKSTMQPFEPLGIGDFYSSYSKPKADLTLLADVRAGEDYVSVVTDMTYSVSTVYFIFTIIVDKPFTARAIRTISMLPEELAPYRVADSRIGINPVAYRRYNTTLGSKVDYFASRIDMGKYDQDNKLVFYVDTLFNKSWASSIASGVDMWNDAFEQIGYGRVLTTKPYPKDSTFDSNSPNGFYIKYAASPYGKAMTSTNKDPRSGEILGAVVHVPFNMTDQLNTRRFLDLSPVDPSSRSFVSLDEDMQVMMKAYVARAVASSLGLAPNYAAASAYPTDSLRSASFTQKYGLCSSITSNNNFNYIAQKEDVEQGVLLVNDRLGCYDYLAIKWLYGKYEGKSQQEQEQLLSELLTSYADDPKYFYGNFWYDFYFGDVRLAHTNLGDDPFLRAEYRLKNLRILSENATEWIAGKDPDRTYRDVVIAGLERSVDEMVSYIGAYIGGSMYHEIVEGDPQPMLAVVDIETQRRALFAVMDMASELSWLDESPLVEGMPVSISSTVKARIIGLIFNKLGTLQRYQMNLDGAYTQQMMSRDMIDYVYADVKAGRKIDEYSMSMQKGFVGAAITKANVVSGGSGSSDKFVENRISSSPMAMAEQVALSPELLSSMGDVAAYGDYRRRYTASEFNEHIFFNMLFELRDIYNKAISTAPDTKTRDFYKYMYYNINKRLEN